MCSKRVDYSKSLEDEEIVLPVPVRVPVLLPPTHVRSMLESHGFSSSVEEIQRIIDNASKSLPSTSSASVGAFNLSANCIEMQLFKEHSKNYEKDFGEDRRFTAIPCDSDPVWIKRDM